MLDTLLDAISRELLSSSELQRRLGVSQPTVSRLIRRAGDRVIRIGRGRATRYAAAREVFGHGLSVPLLAVGETGVIDEIATLRSLANGEYFVDPEAGDFWLRGAAGSGRFRSLPYFLDDLRPSGFLGRRIARRLRRDWGFPGDPREWSDRETGEYLLRRGTDLPGNLVLGDAADRVHAEDPYTVTDRETAYPALAREVLGEGIPGSSAAGEQPKFCVYLPDAGHVIVKFSPSGEGPEASRWRDLILAEHHALETLREHGVRAADATLHGFSGRAFLESRRFDRCGARGRRPAVSLAMVDAEFAGEGRSWSRVARELRKLGLLDPGSEREMLWAETFGAWIGNTDMHLGNVTLAPLGDRFELLPLYDMLPMILAPVRGELTPNRPATPVRTVASRDTWAEAGRAAATYWEGLAEDVRLTPEFRRIAGEETRRCLHDAGA